MSFTQAPLPVCTYLDEADISRNRAESHFGPELTSAGSTCLSAVGVSCAVEVCYPVAWKYGDSGGETARVHRSSRRCGGFNRATARGAHSGGGSGLSPWRSTPITK